MKKENGTVLLLPSGLELAPGPGESILDAALAAGVNLPRSCQSGNCGSCAARLIDGRIAYPDGRPMGLSQEEERAGKVLLCQARARGRVTVEARPVSRAGQARVKRLPCRVESLSSLSDEVMSVLLRLPAVEPLEFAPGQYVDLILPGGERRSFSIACATHPAHMLELHIRRIPGGQFSQRVFDDLIAGAVLRVEGPFGDFTVQQSSRPWLMVAGGTGIAPIKCMLERALQEGEQRPIRLFWGVRLEQDLYAREYFDTLQREFANFRWEPVLSQMVHQAVMKTVADLWVYDIYVAGPQGLVSAVRTEFPDAGANPAAIFFESFSREQTGLQSSPGL
jgi:CDP-4-dehydro-6-deoxyglucose reductase